MRSPLNLLSMSLRICYQALSVCLGPIETDKFLPIHQEAPDFTDMSTEQEILETGIKV